MLSSPHTRYNRLHVYYLDRLLLPPINHPDLIGVWIEDQHPILFFHTAQQQLVDDLCQQTGAQVIYQADLDYNDWEAGVSIGSFSTKTLAIRPVWEQHSSVTSPQQEIVLDPSVIFGSGFHPTTRMCLETLEQVMVESGLKIRTVADLGTGTGLLAIAAAKMGAIKVTALDNNPLACTVARSNAENNGCAAQVEVRQHDLAGSLPDISGYDLVMANLYKGLLLQLFADPSFWKARMYLVSGIIPAMEADLLKALPQEGIRFLHRGNSGMWRLWLLSTTALQGAEQ
jgi:ribosomal protein L11 methyltransferase